jgi:hypothetical protein
LQKKKEIPEKNSKFWKVKEDLNNGILLGFVVFKMISSDLFQVVQTTPSTT